MEGTPNYTEIIHKLEIVSKVILIQLADKVETNKDKYLRNAIARSISLLKAINQLYSTKEYNSGWILYRSLIDRLVYVFYFSDDVNFTSFDNWSFIKTFEYRNNVKSYNKYQVRKPKLGLDHNKSEVDKYYELKKRKIKWSKPDPETVLKQKGFDFLYNFGYDFASVHSHPIVTDGEFEFYSLTGIEPNPYKIIDQNNLIKNSILIHSIIQQEVYNQLTYRFIGVLHSLIEETRKIINREPNEFDAVYQRTIIYINERVNLFEK